MLAAGGFAAREETDDDCRRAANPLLYRNCRKSTVLRACAAFHAGIAVCYGYNLTALLKHAMRANLHTHAATRTFFGIELQSDHVFEVFHTIAPPMIRMKSLASSKSIAAAAENSIIGTAIFISRSTPEREV